MAHKGRAYPLTKHRGLTADAPYPLWAAEGYEVAYPLGATGSFAATVNGRIVRCEHPVIAFGYLYYETHSPLFPGASELVTQLRIGWTNSEPNLRLWQVVLTYRIIFPAPSLQVLATWQREQPEDLVHGLSRETVNWLSAPNPADYDPLGQPAQVDYLPWGNI